MTWRLAEKGDNRTGDELCKEMLVAIHVLFC
jgi:hypothetical protein